MLLAAAILGLGRTDLRYLFSVMENKIPARRAIVTLMWRRRSKSGRKFRTHRGNSRLRINSPDHRHEVMALSWVQEFNMRLNRIAPIVAAAAVAIASPAWAHAHLVKSSPAVNAVAASPRQLSLTFSERIVPAFSKLELVMAMGGHSMAIPIKTAVAADGRTLVGTPQKGLTKGAYLLKWTAATSDGHRMTGSVPFRVG